MKRILIIFGIYFVCLVLVATAQAQGQSDTGGAYTGPSSSGWGNVQDNIERGGAGPGASSTTQGQGRTDRGTGSYSGSSGSQAQGQSDTGGPMTGPTSTGWGNVQDNIESGGAGPSQPRIGEGSGSGNLDRYQTVSDGDVIKASDIIGMKIENNQGEDLGKISDLAIDPKNSRVAYAIVGHGGLLSVGEKYAAIPLSALTLKGDQSGKPKVFSLNMSREQFAQAPMFDRNAPFDRTAAEQSYRYFGQRPYWQSEGSASGSSMGTTPTTPSMRQQQRGSPETGGSGTTR